MKIILLMCGTGLALFAGYGLGVLVEQFIKDFGEDE